MNRKISGNPTRKKDSLHTLDVFIISGPMAATFARRNKVISRTIQICGGQNLEKLHRAIFAAFDREERPYVRVPDRWQEAEGPEGAAVTSCPRLWEVRYSDRKPSGDVTRTTVGSPGTQER